MRDVPAGHLYKIPSLFLPMITFLLFTLFQALITASGSAVLSLIGWRGKSMVELVLTSFLVGVVSFSLILFLILIATIPLSMTLVWVILVIETGIAGFLAYRKGKSAFLVPVETQFIASCREKFTQTSTLKKTLLVLMAGSLVLKLCIALWFNFSAPPYFDDGINNWNARGKTIFFEHGLTLDKNRPDMSFFGGNVPFYPFLTPVFKAGEAAFLGEWHEGYVNTVHLFTLIAFIGILFLFLLRRTEDLFLTTLIPFLFASLPILFFHTFSPYSDLLTGLFVALVLLKIVEWMSQKDAMNRVSTDLILSGIFLFGACFTKNDGLVLGFVSISAATFLFAVKEKNWRYLIPSITAFLLLLPHTIIRVFFGLRLNPVSDNTIAYHDGTFSALWNVMTSLGHDNIFWFAVPLLLLFFLGKTERNDTQIRFAGILLFIFFVMIVFTFGWTANHQFLLDQTTINRTLMQFSASLTVFLGLIISRKGV